MKQRIQWIILILIALVAFWSIRDRVAPDLKIEEPGAYTVAKDGKIKLEGNSGKFIRLEHNAPMTQKLSMGMRKLTQPETYTGDQPMLKEGEDFEITTSLFPVAEYEGDQPWLRATNDLYRVNSQEYIDNNIYVPQSWGSRFFLVEATQPLGLEFSSMTLGDRIEVLGEIYEVKVIEYPSPLDGDLIEGIPGSYYFEYEEYLMEVYQSPTALMVQTCIDGRTNGRIKVLIFDLVNDPSLDPAHGEIYPLPDELPRVIYEGIQY